MTTLIPDSWELPSYLAGDLVPMDKYRNRGVREDLPDADEDGDWERNAEIITHPKWRIRRGPSAPAAAEPETDWSGMANRLSEIEPYDPEIHGRGPAELYSQRDLDALGKSGWSMTEPGVFHRPVTTETGENLGASHTLVYNPGERRPSDNSRAPWHLMADPESVGVAFSTLHGPRGAISAADEDVRQVRAGGMPKHGLFLRRLAKIAAARTPGQDSADDWLERNSPESFENEEWMRAREGDPDEGYTHWEPSGGDYTYRSHSDAVGQSFHGGEVEDHTLPGSVYDEPDDDWEEQIPGWTPADLDAQEHVRQHAPQRATWQRHEFDDNMEDDERERINDKLGQHGFNWEPRDETAGSPENPISPETPGKWVKHQMDPEGNHVATHTLTDDEGNRPGQWSLHTELGTHGLPVTFPHSIHGEGENGLDWALDKYKSNAAEAMLPQHGYERGQGGVWSRSDETPHGTYEHEIIPSDHEDGRGGVGWSGNTVNPDMEHGSYARNGAQSHHSDDLADVVREQHRLSQGLHPGGPQDHRLTRKELLADPSVARLGEPSTISDNFYGDGRVGRASWHIPHPEGNHLPDVHAEATYNWDKGGYDMRYTHDGNWLAASHNAVPAGAPIHVPGRQLSLDFPVSHPFNINDYRRPRA